MADNKTNTRIRGQQIEMQMAGDALVWTDNDAVLAVNDDDTTLTVASDILKVKDSGIGTTQLADDAVDKDKINADVAGAGVAQNVDGSLEISPTGALELSGDDIQVKALGITNAMIADGTIAEGKLDVYNGPTDGYVLGYDATNGMEWVDISIGDNITESDFNFEDESDNTNGTLTAFNLTNTPLANSCQVFLNGLLQQEGAGKDYVLNTEAKTVTFAVAPASGDLLLIFYVEDN